MAVAKVLTDVLFVAADTARARAYAQAMQQATLLPAHALLLTSPVADKETILDRTAVPLPPVEACHLRFVPSEPVAQTLERSDVPTSVVASTDMNASKVGSALRTRPESIVIFAGPGGCILRAGILGLGKSFLHVHGGWLPDYKGSTTNYYSLLEQNNCGASAIIMTEDIDSGPILARRRFPRPQKPEDLDYILDPLFRARVLLDTLERLEREGHINFIEADNTGGRTFYIMHPVLRHLAILGGGKKICM